MQKSRFEFGEKGFIRKKCSCIIWGFYNLESRKREMKVSVKIGGELIIRFFRVFLLLGMFPSSLALDGVWINGQPFHFMV